MEERVEAFEVDARDVAEAVVDGACEAGARAVVLVVALVVASAQIEGTGLDVVDAASIPVIGGAAEDAELAGCVALAEGAVELVDRTSADDGGVAAG